MYNDHGYPAPLERNALLFQAASTPRGRVHCPSFLGTSAAESDARRRDRPQISSSSFFRDAEEFEALAEAVA
jgi:hypothetical protein